MPTFANLPGATVEILDQGLHISAPPTGPRVIVLGFTTSTNDLATPYTPYPVSTSSFQAAYRATKNADGTVSELSEALMECYVAGGRDVAIMNILPVGSGSYTTSNDRYGYLAKAYDVLGNFNADIIFPVGAHIDDSVTANYAGTGGSRWNFGYQLANFCYQATKNNNTTIGVIETNRANASASGTPTLAEIETWVSDNEDYTGFTGYDGTTDTTSGGLTPGNYAFVATTTEQMPANYSGGDVLDSKGNKVDIGAYISVVSANVRATNDAATEKYPTLGYYNSGGGAAYAGLIASLPARSAPTNKVVPGVVLAQGISESQADRLAGKRQVTFMAKPKGVVVASAMTGAYNVSQYSRSDFVRLTTVRIVHDAVNYVRSVADQFIGEPNNAPQRNALATAIDSALKRMQAIGALRRYDFNVFSTPTDQILGKATVELILVPAFELQTITVVVALTSA